MKMKMKEKEGEVEVDLKMQRMMKPDLLDLELKQY